MILRTTAIGVALWLTLSAGGCDRKPVVSAGSTVEYQKVYVQVPRPCPVKVPARPSTIQADAKAAKLALPSDPGLLLDIVTAKLKEWAGDGAYGDKADAALKTCTKP